MKLRRSFIAVFLTAVWLSLGLSTIPNRIGAQSDNKNDLESEAPRPIVIKSSGYKPKPVTEQSREGATHFEQLNCMNCHTIRNTGGVFGPALDGVGGHRSEEFLLAHLANTKEQKAKFAKMTKTPDSLIYHPRVTEQTAVELVAFLETLPEPPGGFILSPHVRSTPAEIPTDNPAFKPMKESATSLEGKKLFDKNGCVACHSIRGIGGWMGPRLDGIGGRRNREDIAQRINKPSVKIRESLDEQVAWPQMPRLDLPKDDVQKITDYLMTLPNENSTK
jgi:cytochrome c2